MAVIAEENVSSSKERSPSTWAQAAFSVPSGMALEVGQYRLPLVL